MLNRLQEIMNTYDFDIIYKKGSKMPAISWDSSALQQAQNVDPLLKAFKNFLLNKELPHDSKYQSLNKPFANDCFIENDIVGRHIIGNLSLAEW
jgi:hypothetical protein